MSFIFVCCVEDIPWPAVWWWVGAVGTANSEAGESIMTLFTACLIAGRWRAQVPSQGPQGPGTGRGRILARGFFFFRGDGGVDGSQMDGYRST